MTPLRNRIVHGVKRIRRKLQRPLLSVIIPAYNEEDTIERAVRSALNQKVDNIEVLVVDDMSTDNTRSVVTSLAKRDRRVKLLSTETNSGPGRARNIGVAAANGRFLAFVDADDRVLPNAYKRMLATIQKTGSQFVSGRYVREGASGTSGVALSQRVHRKQRLTTNLAAVPEVLEEAVLWNKIYNTNFWNQAVGKIPEDRNYEDQEPAIRAAVEADTFDVVDYDVYAWALPEGEITRSQSKASIDDLKSRVLVIEALVDLSNGMPAEAKELLRRTILGRDLVMYLELVPYTSDEYWDLLHRITRRMFEELSPDSLSDIPFRERMLAYLGAYGAREDIEEFLGATLEFGQNPYWQKESDSHWLAAAPYFEDFSRPIPQTIRILGPNDWKVRSRTWSSHWTKEGTLSLHGYAYIPGVRPDYWTNRTINLLAETGETLWSQSLKLQTDEWPDIEVNDALTSYVRSGFNTQIPVPPPEAGVCTLEVVIEIDGSVYRSALVYPDSEVSSQVKQLEGAYAYAFRGSQNLLSLKTETNVPATKPSSETSQEARVQLSRVDLEGNIVKLSGTLDKTGHLPDPSSFEVALIGSGANVILASKLDDGGDWTAHFDLADAQVPSSGMFLRWRASEVDMKDDSESSVWKDIEPIRAVASTSPRYLLGVARALKVARLSGNSVGFTPGPPLTLYEKSRYGKRQMSISKAPALRDAVVFDSFTGKVPTDNPLGVLEQVDAGTLDPDLSSALPTGFQGWPRYWSVTDGTVRTPEGVEPIYAGTQHWFDVIRSARLLITNNHLPPYFVKTPGQFWLQTWHGTPLKRLLFDAPRNGTSVQYRRLMTRQVPGWDLLLAQDDQAAEDLSRSMRYQGRILVTENPRNARLFVPGLREQTRKRLGIPEDRYVILYAPTWAPTNTDPLHPKNHILDPAELAEETGALVLVRAHHMTPTRVTEDNDVIDVSEEPRIEDLMVASDALVSDYSSVFFDYALLGRPMYADTVVREQQQSLGVQPCRSGPTKIQNLSRLRKSSWPVPRVRL